MLHLAARMLATEEKVLFLMPGEEKNRELFKDPDSDMDMDTVDSMPLVEWLART